MTTPRILIPLAPGFEEIEAITIVDVLRRAGLDVTTAGLTGESITGAHGVTVQADTTMDGIDAKSFDMVALPGGLPGAEHLRDDTRVTGSLKAVHDAGGWAAAICAAPIALSAAGLTCGRKVTSYPGFGEQVNCESYSEDRVVADRRVLTSRGPGTSLEFALAIVEYLVSKECADGLREGMLVKP